MAIHSQWGKGAEAAWQQSHSLCPTWLCPTEIPHVWEEHWKSALQKGTKNHCRCGQSSLHKMTAALCKLSWNSGQREISQSPCLFQFPVSAEALLCWRTIQRIRAAFGIEQNCIIPAISHMSVPVYTRGESALVVLEKQPATDSERLLFYSQHSEKSGKKNPKCCKVGKWVLCKTCNFCSKKELQHMAPDLTFPGQPSDSTFIKFSSTFPPERNVYHYSHLNRE